MLKQVLTLLIGNDNTAVNVNTDRAQVLQPS